MPMLFVATQCLLWVELGGKGTSATRLVVPDQPTLAGVGGRSLQCRTRTSHTLREQDMRIWLEVGRGGIASGGRQWAI
jgi:hypothetical protein